MFKGSKHQGWQQPRVTKHEQMFSLYPNNELLITSPDEKLD